MYKYRCKLDRVVDGDTADVLIDLGFDTWRPTYCLIRLFCVSVRISLKSSFDKLSSSTRIGSLP
jgi:hypothetical protein